LTIALGVDPRPIRRTGPDRSVIERPFANLVNLTEGRACSPTSCRMSTDALCLFIPLFPPSDRRQFFGRATHCLKGSAPEAASVAAITAPSTHRCVTNDDPGRGRDFRQASRSPISLLVFGRRRRSTRDGKRLFPTKPASIAAMNRFDAGAQPRRPDHHRTSRAALSRPTICSTISAVTTRPRRPSERQ